MLKSKVISYITAAVMVCFSFLSFLPNVYAEGEPDTIPPEVSSTSPSNGDTGVLESTAISIVFTEDIQAGDIAIYDTISLKKGSSAIPVDKSVSGCVLTITPQSLLEEGTYTVIVPAASVTDSSGNPLSSQYTFSFAAGSSPQVQSTYPANGADHVWYATWFYVYFDQPIVIADPTAVTVTSSKPPLDFTGLHCEVQPGNNKALIITPNNYNKQWDNGEVITYTITIKAGLVSDTYGNLNKGDLTYTFTTCDMSPPEITGYSPTGTQVPLDTPLILTYSKDVYPGERFHTGTTYHDLVVTDGRSDVHLPVNLSIFDGNKVKIEPASGQWPNGAHVSCQIPIGFVQNHDGAETTDYEWASFSALDTIGPVATISPGNGSVKTDFSFGMQVTCDEAIYEGPNYAAISVTCNGEPFAVNIERNNDRLYINHVAPWQWGKTYTINIPAGALQDEFGNTNAEAHSTFSIIQEPIKFSVSGSEGEVDVIKGYSHTFKYIIYQTCNMTLQITSYHKDGVVFRTITANNVAPGKHEITWDGKLDPGVFTGYDTCYVKITATPVDTSKTSASSIYIKLNTHPRPNIVITSFPSTWYPKNKSFYTEFTVNTCADLTVLFIKNGVTYARLVQDFYVGAEGEPDKFGLSWDGKDSYGKYIPSGYYKVVFRYTVGEKYSDTATKYITIKY